eukprot:41037-Eustigmatos_ZCMA.PRE.1
MLATTHEMASSWNSSLTAFPLLPLVRIYDALKQEVAPEQPYSLPAASESVYVWRHGHYTQMSGDDGWFRRLAETYTVVILAWLHIILV